MRLFTLSKIFLYITIKKIKILPQYDREEIKRLTYQSYT